MYQRTTPSPNPSRMLGEGDLGGGTATWGVGRWAPYDRKQSPRQSQRRHADGPLPCCLADMPPPQPSLSRSVR